MGREILGHINCPHCGFSSGMRITLDKSGAPFGYCEANCSGQMRVGGSASRVAKFYAIHPHLKKGTETPSTVTEPEPEKIATKKAAHSVAPLPAPKKPSIFEQLAGVTHG
jgi:hypothetical protein